MLLPVGRAIRERARNEVSTLTKFFSWYAENEHAEPHAYQDFPQHSVWSGKEWSARQQGFTIGRVYFAAPNSGERFYLRLLLIEVKGPKSFVDLRTVDGQICDTFKMACVARGLLENDSEWRQCLQEASIVQTGYQLRRLFSKILTECSPLHPVLLWTQFSAHICDDLQHYLLTSFGIVEPSQSQIQDYGLFLINELLLDNGKSLLDYPPMPVPSTSWQPPSINRLILDQQILQDQAINEPVDAVVLKLNTEQRSAYDAIMSSVLQNTGSTFLSGGAGTGKTYLYNTIAHKCRSLRNIVLPVASSGIAALLLIGGRTAHSTFSIPFNVHDASVCGFSKQSTKGELMRQVKLIIWDEVPMQHRYCIEAVDRTLRDMLDSPALFGGITVVLGGDFRQTLPVIPKACQQQIVAACVRKSYIWNVVQVLTLSTNMRLESSNPGNVAYTEFLNMVGSNPGTVICIPSNIQKFTEFKQLLSFVYPNLHLASTCTPSYLTERNILAPRNVDVAEVNAAALEIFPGQQYTYLAADSMSENDGANPAIRNRYPNEFLNSLNPSGLPPFRLKLKVGCPVILLRNVDPKRGLCNGTRLMVTVCKKRVIEVMILIGDRSGHLEFLPRISLTPSNTDMPFQMTRRQFPVRLAYAMSINKSQGQSIKFVGVDLRNPVFAHGQAYVALSRCTSSDRIGLLLPEDSNECTQNIVYPEVLL